MLIKIKIKIIKKSIINHQQINKFKKYDGIITKIIISILFWIIIQIKVRIIIKIIIEAIIT